MAILVSELIKKKADKHRFDPERFRVSFDKNSYKYIANLGVENFKCIFIFYNTYNKYYNQLGQNYTNKGDDKKQLRENEWEKDLKAFYNTFVLNMYNFKSCWHFWDRYPYQKIIGEIHKLDNIGADTNFYEKIEEDTKRDIYQKT